MKMFSKQPISNIINHHRTQNCLRRDSEERLLRSGLVSKQAENRCSAKVLGLQMHEKKGALRWKRTELKENIEPLNLN